ncbi:MAG: hypothetical protein OEQ14_17765 [Gammaproteobacteria bacterium]|nr:hypothetical protein [Gammaproteobacteria bacterium]
MHKYRSRHCSGAVCLLAVATPACADGGISSLGGLLAGLMMLIGMGGLVLLAFMIPVVRTAIRTNRTNNWTVAALSLGTLYVLISFFFYFAAMHEEWAKFPGFVAAVALALLCIFFLRHHKRLRAALLGAIAITTVALLATPAQFWKGNAFDLVEMVYVDNSKGLEAMLGDDNQILLHLADGRKILQFEHSADAGEIEEIFSAVPGNLVLLDELDAARAGQWFEVTHYEFDRRYLHARNNVRRPPRHSLFTHSVNMYIPNGDRSIGVLLDASAGIDFRAILLRLLGRSGTRSLKSELVNAGGIDVNEQTFIDEAFESQYAEAYRFLLVQGIDANATRSNGESMLHRVAEIGDAALMKFMVSRGASLQKVNGQGLTPLQYFRKRHGHRQIKMRRFEAEFPDAVSR